MSMMFLNEEAANKVIHYLKLNQYLFTVDVQNGTWLIRIKE